MLRNLTVLFLISMPALLAALRAHSSRVIATQFVQLHASSCMLPTIASSAHFPFANIFGSLWKHVVGTVDAGLVAQCRKVLFPRSDMNQVRSEIILQIANGRKESIVEALRAKGTDRIESIPRLPADRKVVLLAEVAAAAEEWRRAIDAVENRIVSHRQGGHVLLQAARRSHGATAGHENAANPNITVMARGAADKERGITHEEAVLEWARQRWPAPGYEILAHAQAYPVVGEPGLVAGMKAEYDALVVDSAQQLTVVVEAKAGGALFDDLAKMLTAREAMVVRGAIHVRCGKQKHAQQKRLLRVPSDPHICYVFGDNGSFEDIASRSMQMTMKYKLLDRCLAMSSKLDGDAGGQLKLTEGDAGVVASFDAGQVASIQEQADAMSAEVTALLQAGAVSFWGRGEACPSTSRLY